MSEDSEVRRVEHTETGFRMHLAIDKELHVESGTRTPDKITLHGSLEGHYPTMEEALKAIDVAKAKLLEVTKNAEAPKAEEPKEPPGSEKVETPQ